MLPCYITVLLSVSVSTNCCPQISFIIWSGASWSGASWSGASDVDIMGAISFLWGVVEVPSLRSFSWSCVSRWKPCLLRSRRRRHPDVWEALPWFDGLICTFGGLRVLVVLLKETTSWWSRWWWWPDPTTTLVLQFDRWKISSLVFGVVFLFVFRRCSSLLYPYCKLVTPAGPLSVLWPWMVNSKSGSRSLLSKKKSLW
jgi:hypothetical protein